MRTAEKPRRVQAVRLDQLGPAPVIDGELVEVTVRVVAAAPAAAGSALVWRVAVTARWLRRRRCVLLGGLAASTMATLWALGYLLGTSALGATIAQVLVCVIVALAVLVMVGPVLAEKHCPGCPDA